MDRRCRETRAAVAEMGGPFFAARGPSLNPPWFGGGGTSNGVQTSVKIQAPGTGGVRNVTVVTMMNDRPRTEETILWRLLGSDLPDPPIFPATSTVHRGKLPVRVVGRRRPVTIYICGPAWVAHTRTGGRRLWIEGYATDPRTIEIIRLDAAALEAAFALSDQVTRWMADQTRPNPLRSF